MKSIIVLASLALVLLIGCGTMQTAKPSSVVPVSPSAASSVSPAQTRARPMSHLGADWFRSHNTFDEMRPMPPAPPIQPQGMIVCDDGRILDYGKKCVETTSRAQFAKPNEIVSFVESRTDFTKTVLGYEDKTLITKTAPTTVKLPPIKFGMSLPANADIGRIKIGE